MPVMTEAPDAKKARYKMRLKNPEFMEEHGKLPAGSVVIVDEETAIRWLEKNIAVQAGNDEKTAAEVRRAEIKATLVPVETDDEPAQGASRPTRRGGRRQGLPARLIGAGVVNDLDDVPDDVTSEDE